MEHIRKRKRKRKRKIKKIKLQSFLLYRNEQKYDIILVIGGSQ